MYNAVGLTPFRNPGHHESPRCSLSSEKST